MARVTLADVRAIPDPVQTWNCGLSIPALGPGIDVRCQTTALPGVETDSVLVALHGFETKYMGREVFSHQLSCTFIETRDMYVRSSFVNWYNQGRDVVNNIFNNKVVYEKTAYIDVFDDSGATIRTLTLYGAYCENINEVTLDGSNAAAMQITVIISFDFFVEQ
jgi:hypothetical protein